MPSFHKGVVLDICLHKSYKNTLHLSKCVIFLLGYRLPLGRLFNYFVQDEKLTNKFLNNYLALKLHKFNTEYSIYGPRFGQSSHFVLQRHKKSAILCCQ